MPPQRSAVFDIVIIYEVSTLYSLFFAVFFAYFVIFHYKNRRMLFLLHRFDIKIPPHRVRRYPFFIFVFNFYQAQEIMLPVRIFSFFFSSLM